MPRMFWLVLALLLIGWRAAGAETWSSIPAPPRLSYHAAVWDSVGGRLVTFDGRDVRFLPDGSSLWSPVVDAGPGPTSRISDFAWAADPAGRRLFVFGGRRPSGTLSDETWVLHCDEPLRWENIGNVDRPAGRTRAALVHDPLADRLVLHGGRSTTDLSDLHLLPLDGQSGWKSIAEIGPGTRSGHVAVYDASGRRMIVYGGSGNPIPVSRLWSDVWALDLTGPPQWSLLTPPGPAPLGRKDAGGVFDPARRRLLVVGGETELGRTNEVISLALDPAPAWLAGPPPVPGVLSSGRAVTFDAAGDRVFVSGGTDTPTDLDVLALAPVPTWIQTGDSFEPPAETRAWTQAVYDSMRDRLTYFAGTWTWEASFATDPPTWSRHDVTGTPPAEVSSYVHDAARDRVIAVPSGLDDQVFFLDLAARRWTSVPASGNPFVPNRGRLVLDTRRDRLLLHVTWMGDPIYLATDLWELPLSGPAVWTRLQERTTPWVWARPFSVDDVYDPLGDRMIADGVTGTPHLCYCYNQASTRSLSFPSLVWTEQPTPSPPADPDGRPDLRWGSRVALDRVRGRVISASPDSYPYDGEVVVRAWVSGLVDALFWWPLAATGAPRVAGSGRREIGLVPDTRHDRLVVTGMESLWFLAYDPPLALPGLVCPADRVWTPGAVDTLRFAVTNPRDVWATVEVRWSGDRGWTGGPEPLPVTRLVTLEGGETREVELAVLVPDSVAIGANRITTRVRWIDQAVPEVTCSLRLGDASTATRWSLVRSDVDVTRVFLVWSGEPMPDGPVAVERKTGIEDWREIGWAVEAGNRLLQFEDLDAGLAGRLYYRLAWNEGAERVTSEISAIDVPEVRRELSLRAGGPWGTGTPWRVAYALPSPGAATIELVSVTGRRLGRWRIADQEPRSGSLELDAVGRIPPGVYGLRLVHAKESVATKVVVLR